MKRNTFKHLEGWSKSPDRKVLLLRGARQVGKTYLARMLGKQFRHFIEVNFEEEVAVRSFFDNSLSPGRIVEKISAYYQVPVQAGHTLLFLDEIQACPEALKSLRFFYEKMPQLHVLAAGSLLEFALAEISSFGVGRISNLFLYPLCFSEFLQATEGEPLCQIIQQADFEHPIDPVFHSRFLENYRIYQLLGGLPAVIQHYINHRDIQKCLVLLDEMIVSFEDDFSKYKKRVPVLKLREVFKSIAHQCGRKFKYSNITEGASANQYKACLDLLIQAGLAYNIYHTSAHGIPLGAQTNLKKFKSVIFDVGIYQRLLGLKVPEHIISTPVDLVHKGNMSELIVAHEIVVHHPPHMKPQLFYWHRESKSSNAEIDYIMQQGEKIIPIEVKAGTKGQMQSLFLFLKERGLSYGLRLSQENFGHFEQIKVAPVYAVNRALELL